MAPTFAQQIAVDHVSGDNFVSSNPPQATGNALPIGYGGCTIAVAIHSACKTVDPGFHVFSVLGAFLGPSRTDRPVHCRVTRVRDTRTFATRHVIAHQLQADGAERKCAHMFIDFHVKEPALLTYNPPLPKQWGSGPTDKAFTLPAEAVLKRALSANAITVRAAEVHRKTFSMIDAYYETYHCVKGMSVQTTFGLDKQAKTTQDELPMHQKSAAEWTRLRTPVDTYMENVSALGFMMDAGLSFLPLHLTHRDFNDSSACSTLDFALRILTDDFDAATWGLRERRTVSGADSRTLSESKLWTQSGRLIAVMSQTSILRPLLSQAKQDRSVKL